MRTHRSVISRRVALVALVTAGAVALAGCGRPAAPVDDGEVTAGSIETTAGFDGETISLGIITVTSGPLAPVTTGLTAAQQAWEKHVNANGGIGGLKVKLVVTDSGYNPAQAIQQYERTKNDVVMFANIFGTPIGRAVLPNLQADQILAEVAAGDPALLRQRETILMFTPIQSQILEGVFLGQEEKGDDATICGAALEGPLTEQATEALDYAAEEMGAKIGTIVSIAQTVTDATPQVLQLQSADCDVVVIQAVPQLTSALLSASAKLGFEPQFVTTSTGYLAVFEDNPLYEFLAEHLLITSDVVPFGSEDAEGMEDLVEAHDKYAADVPPSGSFVQGWVGMLIVEAVLEEAIKRGDLSHEGLIEASNSLSTFDLKGIGPIWGWGEPEDRTAPTTFQVYKPDADNASGIAIVEANVAAPDAAVNYPY